MQASIERQVPGPVIDTRRALHLTDQRPEAGNVAIAGHRTTYGAPFNALAQLGGAITTVKQVYSAMTTPPSVGASGPVPAYLTAEIASYQAALARLTDGASS